MPSSSDHVEPTSLKLQLEDLHLDTASLIIESRHANVHKRPSGTSSGDLSARRDDLFSSSLTQPRQKSSSSVDLRRNRTTFPYRQHSIDAEDLGSSSTSSSSSSHGVGSHEYRLSVGQGQQPGSQPSQGRRSLTRQDYRDGSSPSFASFSSGHKSYPLYEGMSDSHRSGGSHWHQTRQRSFERSHGNTGGRPNDARGSSQSRDSSHFKSDSVEKFDQEFPSLVGAGVGEDPSPVINGSVWDCGKSGKIHLSASLNKKLHLIQKPIGVDFTYKRSSSPAAALVSSTGLCGGGSKSNPGAMFLNKVVNNGTSSGSVNSGGSMYRAVLPAKGLVRMSSRDSAKMNGPLTKVPSSTSSAVGAPVDSLSVQIHPKSTHPKVEPVAVDAGSDSDKTAEISGKQLLAHGCDDVAGAGAGRVSASTEAVVNGIGGENAVEDDRDLSISNKTSGNGIWIEKALKDDAGNVTLSSSLEAEQRLLREMGWKEEGSEDEGVYAPLTEDEKREMEHLSKVFQKRNGIQRNLQVTWSPKRVLPIPKNLDLANEDGSVSSSSDSDSD